MSSMFDSSKLRRAIKDFHKKLHEELSRKNDADKTNVGIWLSGGTDIEQNEGEKDSINGMTNLEKK